MWQIEYAVECAMIEAMQEKAPFTIIGFINGELHVPSYGMIL